MMQKNKKINKLNKEYLDATKRGDTVLAKKIQEEQMKLMKGMWSAVIGRMWVFVPILVLFFGFTYFLSYVNPYASDDIHVPVNITPDMFVGNNTLQLCNITLTNEWVRKNNASLHSGVWTVLVNGKIDNDDILQYAHFLINTKDTLLFERATSGNVKGDFKVRSDKESYSSGDTVKLYAYSPSISNDSRGSVECIFDNGTFFYFDLGFTIPILNMRYITSDYWMFIILSIMFGLGISTLFNKTGGKGRGSVKPAES